MGDLLTYLIAFRDEVRRSGADPAPILKALVPVLVAGGLFEAALLVESWREAA
jgi:predicted HAD superfamily phosphohydrolase